MKAQDIPNLFKRCVQDYLVDLPRTYSGDRYPISEKELQWRFAKQLFENNVPFKSERRYNNSFRRVDFRIFDEIEMAIEIEWYASLGDGFATKTFDDLHKMETEQLAKNEWGMFLALNITDKYSLHNREKSYRDPTKFAISRVHGKKTALYKYWEKKADHDLIHCNPRFWCWSRNMRRKGKETNFTVTVLSCFGRRTNDGWIAT